jgi:IrrE N-terminal-like domain
MSMSPAPDWRVWTAELDLARDVDAVEHRLVSVAADMARYLERSKTGLKQWKRLGVHAVVADIVASGGCRQDGSERVVFVSRRDDPRRRRFTVAHEIAHLLLKDIRGSVRIGRAREERLCDIFAAHLLVPRSDLERVLEADGEIDTSRVFELCNRFGVSLQPMLIALGPYLDDDRALLVAREAGHPRRPEVVDFRFHAAAAKIAYLPRHQRVRSVGLDGLCAWAKEAVGGERAGCDVAVLELRRAGAPTSGVAEGPVRWSARLLPNRLLLATLDLSSTRQRWSAPRAGTAAA